MSAPPIYLDFNATTPIDPAVAEAMLPFLYGRFGNPSSMHVFGADAKSALERARGQVAALLGARPEEIVFTSGGSEANNMVIRGVAAAGGRHFVTSAVEHPAVLEPLRALEAAGCRVTLLPVDGLGRVDPAAVAAAITPETALVTVMHANNEVGTLQPIAEIAAVARDAGVPLHTDAAQSVGKIPVDVGALGVDFLSLAGHKLYAPKGVGALYLRSGRELPPLIRGAGHESGRRAGTENVLEIVGLGRACELAAERLAAGSEGLGALTGRLWSGLTARLPDLRRNGDPERGLPNTLSVSFPGLDASALLAEIGDRVAASAGAACHAEGVELSPVLEAMRVPLEHAMGTVRFSLGHTTTAGEIDRAVEIVAGAAARWSSGAPHGTTTRARASAPRPAAAPSLAATPVSSQPGPPAAGAARDQGSRTGGTPAATPTDDDAEIRLTRFTRGMGCACKLRPAELETLLRALPRPRDPAVLVDTGTADDAAVYRLADDLALVQTVDLFTPVVDDPRDFGAIGAANALSDLYAMGARPLFALSIVGFPTGRLPGRVLSEILAGALEVLGEAEVDLVGGHSIEDGEPKFGLAASGVVHPDRVVRNAGARPGDLLILTKPLGTGIAATAAKRGLADEALIAAAVALMRTLNREAAAAMVEIGAHAATDVTGFGLLGHLRGMTAASGVDAEIALDRVPVLSGVRALAAGDLAPAAARAGLSHYGPWLDFGPGVSQVDRLILADPQTSGGLLIAVAADRAGDLRAALATRGVEAAAIGRCIAPGEGRIRITAAG